MFCRNCGQSVDAGDRFCGHCGNTLAMDAGVVAAAEAAPASTSVNADDAQAPPARRWLPWAIGAAVVVCLAVAGIVAALVFSTPTGAGKIHPHTDDLAGELVPSYGAYLARSQVSEGLALAGGAKIAASEYYANQGYFPTRNAEAGVALPGSIAGKYVSSVRIGPQPGVITVKFGQGAFAGGKLVLVPTTGESGTIGWHCDDTASTIPTKYMPSSCR